MVCMNTYDVDCMNWVQEKLFGVAGLPMVENCLSGYNSCMFAYGQVGHDSCWAISFSWYEL